MTGAWQPSLFSLGSHHCLAPTEPLPCPPSCQWPSKPHGRSAGSQSSCFQLLLLRLENFWVCPQHKQTKSSAEKLSSVLLNKSMCILFPVSLPSFSVLLLMHLAQKRRTCFSLISVAAVSCYRLRPLGEVMKIRVWEREMGLQIRELKLRVF